MAGVGIAYRAWEVALRAGYTNQQTQMPDLAFDPGIPSADVNIVGGGLDCVCKEQGKFLGLIPCGDWASVLLKPKADRIGSVVSGRALRRADDYGNRNPTVNGLYKTTLHTGGVSIRVAY